MPVFSPTNDVHLHYRVTGDGFPILLFAPGGMRSAMSFWPGQPWDPIASLSPHFRVIAMDQRNAGESTAPVSSGDDWSTYTADHLALLDHLGVDRCHLLGGCIGGPYCAGVMQAAQERVSAAVLQQTIGCENNKDAFYEMFDSWAVDLKASHPEASEADWRAFRSNMFDGDFLYNVDRDFIRQCHTPMLLLMGSDLFHPESISREVAALAPDATLIESWSGPSEIDQTVESVIGFLQRHTP